jgi:methionyl-tRNA formyltransferase
VRIVFLGTPELAVPPLDALARAGHDIACVVAQPDRPAGRALALREPATKAWAVARGIPVLQPEKVRDGKLAADLRALAPDLLVVVAYGRILGEDLLTLAPLGAVNVHASLLPRWRGAAPIQWSIASGDGETGVTIMRMDAGLDTGDILWQRSIAIGEEDDAPALGAKLAVLGADALVEALPMFAAGALTPVKQDPAQATIARLLVKEDGRLDFTLPARSLAARVRGFRPWPGAFTTANGQVMKVHRVSVAPADAQLAPGQASATPDGILVGCGEGALVLLEVQLEGRRRMAAAELVKGSPLPPGAVLGR